MYRNLTYIAMIGVPAAPVIFFGWRVYSATIEATGHIWLAIPAALATAVGLEVVGIIAGHVMLENWRREERGRAALAGLILLAYVAIGVYELWGTIGAVAFLIAPLVYVLAALYEALEAQDHRNGKDEAWQRRQEEADREIERKQKEADAEFERQLKLKQVDLQAQADLQIALARESAQVEIIAEKTKASIANAEARKAKALAERRQREAEVSTKVSSKGELSGNALKVFEALQQKPDATNVEIAESLPISPQRVGQIKKSLNGDGQ